MQKLHWCYVCQSAHVGIKLDFFVEIASETTKWFQILDYTVIIPHLQKNEMYACDTFKGSIVR